MLRLRDIMTTEVVTVSPDLSIRDAMALLASRHVGGAPVIAGRKVIGVISMTDLVSFVSSLSGVPTERPEPAEAGDVEPPVAEGDEPPGLFFSELWDNAGAEVSERFAEPGGPEWNVLEEHTVEEAMSRTVRSFPPDTFVDRAADVMRNEGIHRVLVMEEDALVGVVTAFDIADAVADHKLTSRTYVFGRKAEADKRGWY